jgi:ribosomal protein L20A (L18A)
MDVVADDKDGAMEYIYSNFGSRHGVKRRFVVVSSMSEIDPSESTDPRVISAFRK